MKIVDLCEILLQSGLHWILNPEKIDKLNMTS